MRKVSILLEEIDNEYAVKYIEPHGESLEDEEFKAISPTQTLPAILDSDTGVALFESGAILQYLGEKSGQFFSNEIVQRAETVKWLMFEAANLGPVMMELHHYLMNDMGDLPSSLFQRYKNKVAQYCQILNNQLQDRDYLVDSYSIADMAIYPWTVALEDLADVSVQDYPRLNAWVERLNQRSEQLQQLGKAKLALTDWCFDNRNVKVCNG